MPLQQYQGPDRRAQNAGEQRIIDQIAEQVSHLHDCVESVKGELKKNTEATQTMSDILASFRIANALAKWGGAVMAIVLGIREWMHK